MEYSRSGHLRDITLRLTEEQLVNAIDALMDLRDYDRTLDPEVLFESLDYNLPRLAQVFEGLQLEYSRIRPNVAARMEENMRQNEERIARRAARAARPVNNSQGPSTNAMSQFGSRNSSTRRNRRKSRKANRKTRRS